MVTGGQGVATAAGGGCLVLCRLTVVCWSAVGVGHEPSADTVLGSREQRLSLENANSRCAGLHCTNLRTSKKGNGRKADSGFR